MEQEISLHIKVTTKTQEKVKKCHEFQVHVFVENFETLDFGWCLFICMCVCVCVCVCVWGGCPPLQCGFPSRSVQGVWSCLCMTHMKQTPLGPQIIFRHRASCILGQAFRYSPENAFYIFNQQIYFII